MKRFSLAFLLLYHISSIAQCTPEVVSRLHKITLVIGEADYSSDTLGKLINPIHDAVDIRSALTYAII